MTAKSLLVACSLLVGLGSGALAQERRELEAFRASADEYLAGLDGSDRWHGSVLVVLNGKTLLRRAYGLADREHGAPNTPETKYRIGSLTKAFTAAAVLMLVERNVLRIGDRACAHLSSCTESWAPITIHHLLSHQSGIANVTALPDFRQTMMIPSRPRQTVERFQTMPLGFEPGTQSSYSNTGYIVLARIIETASGMSYEKFVKENIFEPLGLEGTGSDSYQEIIPDRAEGYTLLDQRLIRAPYIDMSLPIGGGNLYSTIDDLHRWSAALDEPGLLGAESLQKMFSGDGYAWVLSDKHGKTARHFVGGINGFSAYVASFPTENLFVAVLANVEFGRSGAVGDWLERQALSLDD